MCLTYHKRLAKMAFTWHIDPTVPDNDKGKGEQGMGRKQK